MEIYNKQRKTTKRLSIIIPTYNRSQLLSYSLESISKQCVDNDLFEVIVVDDGSTDDTESVTMAFENRLNIRYLFQEDKGYRPASARNKGILASEAPICLFIDSGVLLDRDCIQQHLQFHERYNAQAAAIGYVYGFEESSVNKTLLMEIIDPMDVSASTKRLSENIAFQDVRESHYQKYNFDISNLPAPWFYFWTGHVSVSRDKLIKVNLFDEAYDGRWGVEDNDLGYNLHTIGVKIRLLKEAKAIHFPHDKDKIKRHMEGYENCKYFHRKYGEKSTELFLKTFMQEELVDINGILLSELIV